VVGKFLFQDNRSCVSRKKPSLGFFWKPLSWPSFIQEVLMLSFILAIGLGQAVAGAECAGGVCPASTTTSSCASGNCSVSSSGGRLFRRGKSGSSTVAQAVTPSVTKEEKKTAEAPKESEVVDSSSSRKKSLFSFRR